MPISQSEILWSRSPVEEDGGSATWLHSMRYWHIVSLYGLEALNPAGPNEPSALACIESLFEPFAFIPLVRNIRHSFSMPMLSELDAVTSHVPLGVAMPQTAPK